MADREHARDALAFFGLTAGREPSSWTLAVESRLCSGSGALFGGAAMGAAVGVLEEATGRSVIWASTQFMHHVRPPSVLRLDVEEVTRGRRASQVRVQARLDGREMFSVAAAVAATLGDAEGDAASASWPLPADVAPPLECPPRPLSARHRGGFMEQVEGRIAVGWPEGGRAVDGRSAIWARLPGLQPGAATLGVFGDYVPFGLRQAVGDEMASHSLDNTLRVLRPPGPGWVLADIAIEGVGRGFGFGRVRLWDEQGRFLATASQSFTCRPRT